MYLRGIAAVLLASTVLMSSPVASQQASGSEIVLHQTDIPSQALASALITFSRQTGIEVLVRSEHASGKTSKAVRGEMTGDAALQLLLQGTDLGFLRTGNDSVRIVPAGDGGIQTGAIEPDGATRLQPIIATGAGETAGGPFKGYVAHRSATATKTDTPLIETPQAVSVVGRDQMNAQGAQTVSEALRYSAGVLTGTAGAQTRYDSVFVRGFGGFASLASYADYLDGLKIVRDGRISTQVDPYLLERVEAFKGPSSVLFGQANPGGFINMVSKRPTDEPFREVELQFGQHKKIQAGFDFSGPLDDEGALKYRLTGLGRYAETWIDFSTDERLAIAPSIQWTPDDATSLTLHGSYHNDPSQFNFVTLETLGTLLPGKPKVPSSFYDGDKDWSEFSRKQAHVGYEFEHEFDSGIQIRQNVRYQKFSATTREISVWGFNDYSDPQSTLLDRAAMIMFHDWTGLSTDTQLQASLDTGPIEHTLLLGFDYRRLSADRSWSRYDTGVPPIDYLNPDNSQPIADPALAIATDLVDAQKGVYVQDQMSWQDWHLMIGARYDWARENSLRTDLDTGEGERSVTNADAPSWRVGLVKVFDNGLAPYVSYSTSFEPAYGEDWKGRPFKPTEGQQYEVGVKYQPPEIDASITISAFQLTKQNVTTTDPDPTHLCDGTPDCSAQTGEIRSRGLEIEAQASLDNGWDIAAAANYWDVEKTRDEDGFLGKRPNAVPEHSASLWLNHTFLGGRLEGLAVGAGVRYVGSTFADNANTLKVPAYTLVDAAVSYDFGETKPELVGLKASLNVHNLFDEDYVASCDEGWCQYGERRTVFGTLRYTW
ncbi:TonB-dependent siderophore receptor [Ensifer sp.]|jgi:iron complex outermembrane receptor protein|uniref:TonB-dependent siderophore receptor n=1 Tax=Ensifer sp. TaxID=1872086 RepID=UPI002E140451|nr:TonB-dependent siderophore receptor [Ensifer sp.]